MKRILLTVAYDGTGYSGFQAQKTGVPTIAKELDQAITDLTGRETEVSGASRTDAGVHALCNLAVFDTDSRIPGDKFAAALNVRLPGQIRILSSKEVASDFHPRFCDTVKTYEYRIYNAPVPSPQRRLYSHYSYTPFDVEKMRLAAQYLVGTHDFASFCSIYTQAKTTVRTILSIDIREESCPAEITAARSDAGAPKPEDPGAPQAEDPGISRSEGFAVPDRQTARPARSGPVPREIVIEVRGTGFLYNMVRIIAGTLMEVGRGAIPPQRIPEILQACDRTAAGPTAPPQGLTLTKYEIFPGKA